MINSENFFKFILLLNIRSGFYIMKLIKLLNVINVVIKMKLFIILKLDIKKI